MRSGTEAFFQVAVALIPAFLFGGAMRRPEQGWPTGRWMWLPVVLILLFSLVAEVFAIRGVIDPDVSRFEELWVVGTIVGGTVLIAALTAWTWQVAPAHATAPGPPAARMRTKRRLILAGVFAGVCVAAFALAAVGITASLDHVEARNELSRADQQVRATSAELASADRAVSDARASLIATLLDMKSRTRESYSGRVERGIHAIDRVVQPLLMLDRPRAPAIETALAGLAKPTARLRNPFYHRLETDRSDPEIHLGALAVDRLIHAEYLRVHAKKRNAQARRHHAKWCDELAEAWIGEDTPLGCSRAPS
jgi:hypothetical protein